MEEETLSGDSTAHGTSGPPEAGAGDVSRLLEELAATPERELREAWERGLQPGAVVGRFELLRELGRGGFGVVYEARDRELGRLVAFKAIRPGNRSLAELRQRWLQREAEAAAQLNHPNIVTLHDFGRSDAGPYLILELLHGRTLQQRLEAGPLPLEDALRISIAVARALAHAHACGVVHRDLKPANVFLADDGAVKVLDFGLAGILTAGASSGGGTPAFMAPEQWRREGEDERTDLFAFGVMIHAMISGVLPFRASSGSSAVLEPGPAPPLTGVPAALSALVSQLLEKDRDRRPTSTAAVLQELEAIARTTDRRARPRRSAWRWAGLALALVAAAATPLVWRAMNPPALTGERVVVAVADFVNETGEADLDGLSGMLITSLEESRRLAVLTRSRMLDAARRLGRTTDAKVDEPLGRAVARELGARALLLTTIRRFDTVYAVELQALDPVHNEYLFTVSEQGTGKQSIPVLIDRLSERTRRELREQAADVDSRRVKLADAVTDDLEAYRHYFRGQQCIEGLSHLQDCAAEFRRAIAIDPDFALAHWMLAYTGEFRGAPVEEQRAAIGEAMRRVDRVPWKDGQLIRAWAAHVDGKDDEALAMYRAVIDAFPQDRQAQYLAGDLLYHEGRAASAIPYFERALELGHPAAGVIRSHLVDSLAIAGRAADGLARARQWAEDGDLVDARVLASAAGWAGKPEEAAEILRSVVARSPDPETRLDLAAALTGVAQYDEAEKVLREVLDDSRAKIVEARAWAGLAILRAYAGQQREAWKLLERARESSKEKMWGAFDGSVWHALQMDGAAVWQDAQSALKQGASPKIGGRYALLLAYAGDAEHARELEHHITPGTPYAESYDAIRALRRGDREGALAIVRASRAPPIPMVYAAGQAALEAGNAALAAEWLERLRLMTMGDGGGLWRAWVYPRSLYLSAVAHEQLGQPERALTRVDELLRTWRNADPGTPLLAEARALRARLERVLKHAQD